MRRVLLVCVVLAAGLTGCGSGSSSQDSTRHAVQSMKTAVQHFNATNPSSLPAEAAACDAAGSSLKTQSQALNAPPPAGKQQRVAAALRRTYVLATAGFADCARGARSGSYPLLARAVGEIQEANAALGLAQKLDT